MKKKLFYYLNYKKQANKQRKMDYTKIFSKS